jgi:cyclopropane fatty-acyl-phospholipid synthase-like methyltransferase
MTPPQQLGRPLEAPTCSDGPMWSAWLAAFHAPALAIADEVGLFSALRDRPASASELAAQLQIELRATEALAGLLAALDFLVLAAGRFCLTETARAYLLPDSPYYWGAMLRRIREVPLDARKLVESLRRGTAAADARVTEMWRAPAPEAIVAFTRAMHAHSFALAMRTMPAFGLAGASRLLDVAGGSGSYSIAAALHDPVLRCSVLDLPAVCGVAREYAVQHEVGERVATIACDMFAESWPLGHDRILLSDVLHDWDDERCAWLAARAYDALAPGGRILVHEMVLSDGKDGPLPAAAYSVVMLFVAQGRQRSAREISECLAGAGFSDRRVTMTSGGYAVISGAKT